MFVNYSYEQTQLISASLRVEPLIARMFICHHERLNAADQNISIEGLPLQQRPGLSHSLLFG
jgi:hypothetical protein